MGWDDGTVRVTKREQLWCARDADEVEMAPWPQVAR